MKHANQVTSKHYVSIQNNFCIQLLFVIASSGSSSPILKHRWDLCRDVIFGNATSVFHSWLVTNLRIQYMSYLYYCINKSNSILVRAHSQTYYSDLSLLRDLTVTPHRYRPVWNNEWHQRHMWALSYGTSTVL